MMNFLLYPTFVSGYTFPQNTKYPFTIFSHLSTTNFLTTKRSIFSVGINGLGFEPDCWPVCSAQILRIYGAVPSLPMSSIKHMDSFTACLQLIPLEKTPSLDAKSSLICQGLPHVLWNLKFQYCVDKSPPLVHPEPLQFNQHPHTFPLRIILILSSH
jgi:hypothetical protein